MEALGLVCMFGLTTIDDIRTKQIKLLQVIVFGIIGIALEIIYKNPFALTDLHLAHW